MMGWGRCGGEEERGRCECRGGKRRKVVLVRTNGGKNINHNKITEEILYRLM